MDSAPDQRAVWESIAASFDRTRDRTWPHVVAYLEGLSNDATVLDLMCGNGRHGRVARELGHNVVSFDWARNLVAFAHQQAGGGVVGDATRLPLANDSFDACTYVAGWHGIPSAPGRRDSLRELHRVLRPGGTAQITVWSRDAPRFKDQGTSGEPMDVVVPWRSDGLDEARTYHLTTLPEFVTQCEHAGFTVLHAEAVAVAAKTPDNLVVEVQA